MPSLNVHVVAFASAAVLAAGGIAAAVAMASDGAQAQPAPASTATR